MYYYVISILNMAIIEKGGKFHGPVNKFLRRAIKFVLIVLFLLILIVGKVQNKYKDQIFTVENTPSGYDSAVVFGAGLRSKGTPGLILADRVYKSIELYRDGKVKNILMSGDNQSPNHNEVQAMKNAALNEGVPENIILMDHAGLSTIQSCLNLKNELHLQKVVLVTQAYHLPRALYDCNEIGVEAIGVAADEKPYPGAFSRKVREWFASVRDWVVVKFN